MTDCTHCQSQLLDYLYDLLDPTERQVVERHLEQCAACREGLARARVHQRLLATAAKSQFPAVSFQLPSRTAAPRRARRAWTGWAIAASLLLVASAGVATPLVWHHQQEQLAAQAAARHQELVAAAEGVVARRAAAVESARREAEKLQAQLEALPRRYTEELRAIQNRQLQVVVSGPEALQPGAVNAYDIHTRNLANQPVTTQLTARVVDQDRVVVYESKAIQCNGQYRLTLPPDLPLQPQRELFLEVAARQEHGPQAGVQSELCEKLKLAGPLYVTHLATDKPMYRPGEVVRFRSLTLDRVRFQPPEEDLHLVFTLTKPTGEQVPLAAGLSRLLDPQKQDGALLAGPDGKPLRGVGAGEFHIEPSLPGGEYTLTVAEANQRFPAEKRKFLVNKYERPQLNKELEFGKKSYGPGDEVTAACRVSRAEGGAPVANRPVTATVLIDGKSYGADGKESSAGLGLRTDATGAVAVRFRLPAAIEQGQGSLSVAFSDGANRETIVRPIPIVLRKLFLDFYPEGGDLVAGVPNRVYFQARTSLGKPAELRGRVVDQDGQVAAADVATLNDPAEPGINQGLGAFTFTPRAGSSYELKIDTPAGMEGRYPLPAVKADGVVLSVPTGVTAAGEPIRIAVHSVGKERSLYVGAYCRGRLLDHQAVTARPGTATEVRLTPAAEVGGVYRVTVFEDRGAAGKERQLVPVAERLVYRRPAERLDLAVKTEKKQYIPGDKVKVGVTAATEKGQAAPAVVTVAVVDKSVLTLADEKTFRSLPTHFLLTTEVRKPEDLEHADVLLGTHTRAPLALDLLLGTQGWRRFAEQDPAQFREQHKGDDADRLLALSGQVPSRAANLLRQEVQGVQQKLQREAQQLRADLARAEVTWQAAVQGEAYARELQPLRDQAQEVREEHAAAVARLDWLAGLVQRWERPALVGGLLLIVLCLILAVLRAAAGAVPYYVAAGVVALVLLAVVALAPQGPGEVGALVAALPELEPLQPAPRLSVTWLDRSRTDPAKGPQGPVPADEVLAEAAMPRPDERFLGRFEDAAALRGLAVPGGMPGMGGGMPADGNAALWGRFGVVVGQNGAARNDLYFIPPQAEGRAMKEGKDADAPPLAARRAAGPEPLRRLAEKKEELANAPAQERMPAVRVKAMAPAAPAAPAEPMPNAPRGNAGKEMRRAGAPAATAPVRLEALERDVKKLADKAQPERELERLRQRPDMLGDQVPAGGDRRGGVAGHQMGGLQAPGGGFGFGGRAVGGALGLMPPAQAGMEAAQAGQAAPTPAPLVVREYAHTRSQAATEVRSDFTETLLWQPALVLRDGKAEVSFDLSDSVTSYEIAVFGHSLDGRLGACKALVESRLPFALEPKLPVEVTAGDKIDLPISIANNTPDARTVNLHVSTAGLTLVQGKLDDQLTLAGEQRARRVLRFEPAVVEGEARINLEGQSRPFVDGITRGFTVVPAGFPVTGAVSDMLEKEARHEVALPDTWLKGTLKCEVQVYPSTLASLQKGLEGMLREPCGCFEQTSTSNYPNLLILDYLRESNQARPEVEKRASDLLARGYQKLVSFECLDQRENRRRGYEWFGGTAPAHEALTAYGLLQFRDMARVYPVDAGMVERTREYLMARKDGKGGFQRNPRALDSFGRAPDDITNAYIVWAITESSKDDDVARELAAAVEQAKISQDPYFLALVANSLINRDRAEEAVPLLQKLVAAQKPDGHLDAARTSITGSGGRDLQIETTALTVLAWLKANRPEFARPVHGAVTWLGQQRGGRGTFGSTQSTILALKALIAHARANKRTPEAGELLLHVGDQTAARLRFPAHAQDVLTLAVPEPEKLLRPGKNPVRIEITGKSVFPYTLTWSYQTLAPLSSEGCPVRLTTRLNRDTAREGETLRLTVGLENVSGQGQGMAVAIIGLPAGLTLPEDMKQLKEHARLRDNDTEPGLVSAWETRGREVILYWRDLAPGKKIEVPLDLICRVPGEYSGPASRAYLYYNADRKSWAAPLKVTIDAQAE